MKSTLLTKMIVITKEGIKLFEQEWDAHSSSCFPSSVLVSLTPFLHQLLVINHYVSRLLTPPYIQVTWPHINLNSGTKPVVQKRHQVSSFILSRRYTVQWRVLVLQGSWTAEIYILSASQGHCCVRFLNPYLIILSGFRCWNRLARRAQNGSEYWRLIFLSRGLFWGSSCLASVDYVP
jgi:hypothetical protein